MAKQNVLLRSKVRQAESLLGQGKLREAHNAFERICQLDKGNAGFWARLGIIKRRLGEYAGAEQCGAKAVALSPMLALAHHALGSVLHMQKRLDEAIACYHKAIQLQPDFSEAYYYLANALRESGKLYESVPQYYKLLHYEPDHVAGLNNLGAVLTNLGNFGEAVKLLARALEFKPDSVEILTSLGRAHMLTGNAGMAISLLRSAIAIRADFQDAYLELAGALHLDGNYDEALQNLDTLLRQTPGHRKALVAKAKVYEVLGENEEASALLQPLLGNNGAGGEALCVFFDISHHTGQRSEAVALLQEKLKQENIIETGAASLNFRLGRHFDQEGDYETAFLHYSKGNEQSNRQLDLEQQSRHFDAIRGRYNSHYASNMVCSTNPSDLPVFIVGMPRSGTSLVEQIIASHPDVYGAGELRCIKETGEEIAQTCSGRQYPDFAPLLSETILNRFSTELEKELSGLSPTAARITDKMPHNFLHIGLILQLFPECRIIHCKRNPLDTCLSCYFSEFGSISHNYAYDLGMLGRYYGLYSRLMEHWMRLFPGRIQQVVYEELVEDQESVSRSLLEYCGIPWSDQCLDFHTLDRVLNTISYKQVQQPLYKHSVSRWRNYEKNLGPLRDALDQSGVSY